MTAERARVPVSERSPLGVRVEDGFTLIEVMMAIAILAVLSLSTALVIVPVSREHRSARESDNANAAVRNILEGVHATPFNEITTRYPDGSQIPIDGLDQGRLTISYENVLADPLVMQIELFYDTADSGAITRSFFTVRTE